MADPQKPESKPGKLNLPFSSKNKKSGPPEVPGKGRIMLMGVIGLLFAVLRNVFLGFLLLFFLATGLTYFKDVGKYPAFTKVMAFEKDVERPLLAYLKENVPTDFKGNDVSQWILFGGCYFISVFMGVIGESANARKARLKKRRDALVKAAQPLLRQQHDALKAGTLDRSELLEIYAQTKKTLEQQKKNLAFLSIDVVDSTGMKVGEEQGIAERDFRQYKFMVERVLQENKAWKSTWTPDGVMICFTTVPDAIRAGQGIIKNLGIFNQKVKSIKKDFAIRVGINSGLVFCDESTPMEEMTDRVIDIAGHMQKHGSINAVCITKHAIEPYLDKFNFVAEDRMVDGCPVYQWKDAA